MERRHEVKVAIFVQGAMVPRERMTHLSGHIQIPIKTVALLNENGHDVTLFTSRDERNEDDYLPDILPSDVEVKMLPFSSRGWPQPRLKPVNIAKTLIAFWREAAHKYDVIHWFGSERMGLALGALNCVGLGAATVFSPTNLPTSISALSKLVQGQLYNRIDCVVVSTEIQREAFTERDCRVAVARPGVLKIMGNEKRKGQKHRRKVLFWRSVAKTQGGPEYIEAVRRLAGDFPEIEFVFAVRREGEIDALTALAQSAQNVTAYIMPYPEGVTLEGLLSESICVVLPFRRLSISPQLSILETMYAGVAVITTNIESNSELVEDGRSGMLIKSNDVDELEDAVRNMINHPKHAMEMGMNAKRAARERWNWQGYKKSLQEVYREVMQNNQR